MERPESSAEHPSQQLRPIRLETLPGCRLSIGRYPTFAYDASGGGGDGWSEADGNSLGFAAAGLVIPPLNSRSTRFLGLPLPPGPEITIRAQHLQGSWEPASGRVSLAFEARFSFQLRFGGSTLYTAPDLWIACELSSAEAAGRRHRAQGTALRPGGEGVLVGVAAVAPSGDALLDRFLGLPDEALAVLHCRIHEVPA